MNYLQAQFSLSSEVEGGREVLQLLPELLGEIGFEAFEEEAKGINAYIPAALFRRDELEHVLSTSPMNNFRIVYCLRTIEERDWNEEWEKQGFAPVIVNELLLIYDATQAMPATSHPIKIAIQPQLSFGSGTHETTQMLLDFMTSVRMKDTLFLDCGCGTGILSIAAAKLGAKEITAFDIDPWSVKNTIHNAELNDVANICAMEGDVETVYDYLSSVKGLSPRFDVIAANINRNTLMSELPKYKGLLAEGGMILLSGFYGHDVELMMRSAAVLGLRLVARRERNSWALLALQ